MELLRQYGVESWIVFPWTDINGDVVSGIGGGEIEAEILVWADGAEPGTFGVLDDPAEIGSEGVYKIKLTAAQLSNDLIYIKIRNSGSQGAKMQHILIRTMVGDPALLATTTGGSLISLSSGGVDVRKWLGQACTAVNDNGVPVVDVTSIDGELLAGNNATLKLGLLNITNAAGTAVTIAGGSNGHGVLITGNGSGEGMNITGGATGGHGIQVTGGADDGDGINVTGGASNGTALKLQGDGTGEGLSATGGETGNGIEAVGGSTSGSGIKAHAQDGDGHGIEAIGDPTAAGAGSGIHATGGLSGDGIEAIGGTTTGAGIYAHATAGNNDGIQAIGHNMGAGLFAGGGVTGNGIEALGGGTSGDGIKAYADTNGDGISATGASNGHGLDCDGAGSGEGISATGGATGEGMECIGGATSGAGFRAAASNNDDAGMELVKDGTGKDIDSDQTDYIGTPVAVDGSDVTLAAMIIKIFDDNGGATYDAETDSLVELHDDHITFIDATPLTAAQVNTEVDTALSDINLDHLLKVDTGVGVDADLAAIVTDGSVMAHLMTTDLDSDSYNCSTDSLQAIRDNMAGADAAAIAEAVWDELVADITQAGSIGVFLKNLSSTAGAGAITYTYTVYDVADGTTPVPDVDVWVKIRDGGTILGSGKTDAAGEVVFYLDAGDYDFYRQKSGWDFTNPDQEDGISA